MADSKIAALRAASSNAPAAPSGPQALSYPWMTAAGRELVMPVRPPPASPKARRPPDLPPSEGGFKSSPPPDVPPTAPVNGPPASVRRPGRGRERGDFGDLIDVLPNGMFRPRQAAGAPTPPSSPAAAPPGGVPMVNMDLGLLEYMNPGRVELGPEPAAAPAPQDAPLPLMADFNLLDYIQPVLVQGEAPVAVQPAPAQDYGLQDARARIPPELLMAVQPAPAPGVELPPQEVPYQPGIVEPEALDPALLEYLSVPRRARAPVAK